LKIAKLEKFGEPYLDFGKEIAKSRRQKVSNFYPEEYAIRILYLTFLHFPRSCAEVDHPPKNVNFFEFLIGCLGHPVRARIEYFCRHMRTIEL